MVSSANNRENIEVPHKWPFLIMGIITVHVLNEGQIAPFWLESPITGGFPSQRASNMESISMTWCHDTG